MIATKVFLDTNVLLDIAIPDRPGQLAASKLFKLVCDGDLRAELSASSLKDFYHITRKTIPEAQRRKWISVFLRAFEVIQLSRSTCQDALASDEPDFEDGLIRSMAERTSCAHIISRDARAFVGSCASRLTSEELLALLLGGDKSTQQPDIRKA